MGYNLNTKERAEDARQWAEDVYPDGPPNFPPDRRFSGFTVVALDNGDPSSLEIAGYGVATTWNTDDKPGAVFGATIRWGTGHQVVSWNLF